MKQDYSKYIGLRSGTLTIIKAWRDTERGETMCECRCDCGMVVTTFAWRVAHGRVKTCRYRDRHRRNEYYGTRIYRVWQAMKNRCRNPNAENYKYYGGRGVRYCEEWENFDAFLSWAQSSGYRDDLTIDRIDCNGDYCPSNCRWATREEQQANKRTSFRLQYNGEIVSLKHYCKLVGASYTMLSTRVKRKKMTIEQIQEQYGYGTKS